MGVAGSEDEINDLRKRLEAVADNWGSDDFGWHWDATQMHLTITNPKGDPVATLHIERTQ